MSEIIWKVPVKEMKNAVGVHPEDVEDERRRELHAVTYYL